MVSIPMYQALMPAVLAGCAGIIALRSPWSRYPALFSWALLTAFFVGLTWGGGRYPAWIMFAAAAILPLQVWECLRCSRIRVGRKQFCGAIAAAIGLALLLTFVTCSEIRWTVVRSYYQLGAMAAMLWATTYRLRVPILESRRDTSYRLGMTVWLAIKAPSSTFVRGGIGARMWPGVGRDSVESWCYWLLMICIVGMALAMYGKLPGRKRAAKSVHGITRTGLIETGDAA